MSDNLGLIVEFAARDDKVNAAFKNISSQTKAMQSQVSQTNKMWEQGPTSAIAGFNQLRGILAGIGVTALVSGLVDIVREVSHIYDETQKLGVSVASFQQLAIVGKDVGVSTENLQMSLFKMNKTLGDAGMGTKQAVDALAELGFTVKDFIGLSPDQSFLKIAKALGSIGNEGTRTSVAVDIFGKGAKDAMGLFTSDVDKAVASIKKLDVGLSQLQAKTLDDLSDSAEKWYSVLTNKVQKALANTVIGLKNLEAAGIARSQAIGNNEMAALGWSNTVSSADRPNRGVGTALGVSQIPNLRQNSVVDTTAAVQSRINMNKATDMATKALSEMAKSSNTALIAFNSFKNAADGFTKGKAGEIIQNASKAANPYDVAGVDSAQQQRFENILTPIIQRMQGLMSVADPRGGNRYLPADNNINPKDLAELQANAVSPAMREVVKQLQSQQQNFADQNKLIQELQGLKSNVGVAGNPDAQKSIDQLLGSINENTDPSQLLRAVGDLRDGITNIVAQPAKVDIQLTVKPSKEFETEYKISGTGGVKQLESMLNDMARQQGRRGQ